MRTYLVTQQNGTDHIIEADTFEATFSDAGFIFETLVHESGDSSRVYEHVAYIRAVETIVELTQEEVEELLEEEEVE